MGDPIEFEAHDSYVLGLKFTADGETLVSCGMDNVVKLWDTDSWRYIKSLEGHTHSVHTMDLSPDEKRLVTGSSDKTVKIWSFPEGEELVTLQDRKQVVSAVTISADGEWIAAGSYGGRVMVWTINGVPVVGIKASKKNLSSVAFSPDKEMLAAGGLGDAVSLWRLPSGEPAGELHGHKTAVMNVRFIENGRLLSTLGYEQTLKFWDTGTWEMVRKLKPEAPTARGIIFSGDGQHAALLLESRVDVMRARDWKKVRQFDIKAKSIGSAAFSPDGRRLAVGAADKKIRIWEL
ncbi:MAG: WD40 repeat domain-containing protein [Candidatus Promineifilaceae bacterium]|jgi:WD40 repeat protein